MAVLKMQYSHTSPFLQTDSHKPLKTWPVKLILPSCLLIGCKRFVGFQVLFFNEF